MADKSEQSNATSAAEQMAPEAFGKLSLADMEKALKAPPASVKEVKTQESNDTAEDQEQENSDTSAEESDNEQEETTDTQNSDQTSDEDNDSSESDSSESEASDKQKEDSSSDNDKFDYKKAYKELQAEFTRRNQANKDKDKTITGLEDRLSKLEKGTVQGEDEAQSPKKENEKLAQLRKKDPEAAALLESMINEVVEQRVSEKVKPVEEQVTLRRRQEHANKFAEEITKFQKSELAELEPQLLEIYNKNPNYWQQLIWDKDTAFQELLKELYFNHMDKIADIKGKKAKSTTSSKNKKESLNNAQVGTKTKVTQPAKDAITDEEFRKLSLEEMEKRLPRIRN